MNQTSDEVGNAIATRLGNIQMPVWNTLFRSLTMKASMEASREESAVQRTPKVKEFPEPDSRLDWKYLVYVGKERMAA